MKELGQKIYRIIYAYSENCVILAEKYLAHREEAKTKAQQSQERYARTLGKWGAKAADWGMAFLWAAVWVFFINQYLLQAYVIPSESMVPSLQVGDRVFVNKLIAGPELLPGFKKLPPIKKPKRGEIIIFSNPELSAGHPVFQVLHRLVYMLSLSTIDLGGRGNLPQLLVKRAVGANGDHIYFRDGNLFIKPRGTNQFFSELEFQSLSGINYPVQRIVPAELIAQSQGRATFSAYQLALSTSSYPKNANPPVEFVRLQQNYEGFISSSLYDLGEYAARYTFLSTLYSLMPYDKSAKEQFLREDMGYYVDLDEFLPLGDNRDNSRDGRYFGSIRISDVLGYSLWRFYPFKSLGGVK